MSLEGARWRAVGQVVCFGPLLVEARAFTVVAHMVAWWRNLTRAYPLWTP